MTFLCGANVFLFWLTSFLWDYLSYIVTIAFMNLTIFSLDKFGWTTPNGIDQLFEFFLVFGLTAMSMNLLTSKFFQDPSSGFAMMSILNFIMATPIYLIVSQIDALKSWHEFLMFYPHYALSQSMTEWNNIKSPNDDWFDDFTCMFVIFACSILILLIIEFQVPIWIISKKTELIFSKQKLLSSDIEGGILDFDVVKEKQRIDSMQLAELTSYNLVVRRLSKFFGKFLAVNQTSFAIKSGECFGLLGTSGAGKTMIFKMLTGEERISDGKSWVRGTDISKSPSKDHRIGYCPQFDALFGEFTGRETLGMYCLLRGIPQNEISKTIHKLSTELNFFEYLDKKVCQYSGGNKRKLSTAIALVGKPFLLFLDEPTTGMDPKAKNDLWNVLNKIKNSGISMVLSSHCMEECETLCTDLTIMVNGEFKCLGSPQKLKRKFINGIILTVKIEAITQ